MSILSKLMVDTKSAWIEYPGLKGFEVEVVNQSRQALIAIRKSAMETKFDRKTRLPQETLSDEKFIAAFSRATIKNWKGLKTKYLEDLLLVDLSDEDPEKEVPYSVEDAEALMANSGDFDQWMNEVVFDLQNFRTGSDGSAVGKTGEVAELPRE